MGYRRQERELMMRKTNYIYPEILTGVSFAYVKLLPITECYLCPLIYVKTPSTHHLKLYL